MKRNSLRKFSRNKLSEDLCLMKVHTIGKNIFA